MKKRFAVLLPVMICLMVLFCMTTAYALSMGDVDGNGRVTASDARLTLRVAAVLDQFTPEQKTLADVDSDGKITARDARKILRVAAHLDEFDVPEPDDPTTDPKPELTPSEIHDMASAYTVEITAENDNYISTGSGFFITDDGQVVTNYHVIEGMYAITVTDYAGNTYPVTQILAYAADLDLAVLQIDAVTQSAVLEYGTPKTGAQIYTLGSSDGMTDTFTSGIISNNARVDETYNPYVTYYQITAPITHGNSGGPLINAYGEVIGVNTWTNTAGQNMNFSVPVRYLDQLDYGNPVTPEEFGSYFRPDSGNITANMSEIYLCPGGTARIRIDLSEELINREVTLTVTYDTTVLDTQWSDWYVDSSDDHDVIFLFVTGLQPATDSLLDIYVTDDLSICTQVSVDVTPYGWEDYGGDAGSPDFGAFVGVSPYDCWIADEADAVAYTYSFYDVVAAGADENTLLEDFPALLNRYGYELTWYGMNEYGDYEMRFVDAAGDYYSYYFIYDESEPDTITDIMILFSF